MLGRRSLLLGALVVLLVSGPGVAFGAANTAPSTPSRVGFDRPETACAIGAPYDVQGPSVYLTSAVQDPDGDRLTVQWQLWRAGHGQVQRYEQPYVDSGDTVRWEPSRLDTGRYSVRVRAVDAELASPWSAPCTFTVDAVPPRLSPRIASPDFESGGAYPTGKVGVPAQVILDTRNDRDVVAIAWSWAGQPYRSEPLDRPGGRAVVTLTPVQGGWLTISAYGVDRAGYRGPTATYDVEVSLPQPSLWWPLDDDGQGLGRDALGDRDLTVSGVAVVPGWYSSYRPDHAVEFDGPGAGGPDVVGAAGVVDTTRGFSVLATIRPMTLDADLTILSQSSGSLPGLRLGYDLASDLYFGEMAFDAPDGSRTLVRAAGSPSAFLGQPEEGRWNTVALVYNPVQERLLFYSGCEEGPSVSVPGAAVPAGGPMRLGTGGAAADWTGAIGDVRVFDVALTPADLGDACTTALPAPPEPVG